MIARLNNFSSTWRMNAFQKLALVALWTAISAGIAYGHATLLQTYPAAGSRINDAPRTVRLSFDERVERVFNSVYVVDSQGRRVDDGESQVIGEGDVVEVGLKTLEPGQYIVLWKVNSVDGHQVQGRFGFGFQSAPPTEEQLERPLVPEQRSFWRIYTVIVKWIGLTVMAIWLGGMAFLSGIIVPVLDVSWDVGSPLSIANAVVRPSVGIVRKAALLYLCAEFLSLIGHFHEPAANSCYGPFNTWHSAGDDELRSMVGRTVLSRSRPGELKHLAVPALCTCPGHTEFAFAKGNVTVHWIGLTRKFDAANHPVEWARACCSPLHFASRSLRLGAPGRDDDLDRRPNSFERGDVVCGYEDRRKPRRSHRICQSLLPIRKDLRCCSPRNGNL